MLDALVIGGLLLVAAAVVEAAWRPSSARAMKAALRVVACLAAAPAFLTVMAFNAGFLTQGPCAPTAGAAVAAADDLRLASVSLLMFAASLWHAAKLARMVPVFAPVACALGAFTAYRAWSVLLTLLACHGPVQGEHAAWYWLSLALFFAALPLGVAHAVVKEDKQKQATCTAARRAPSVQSPSK